jgi:hypothetical protein
VTTQFWTAEDTAHFTAEDIAALLPPSWAYSFVSLEAALNYYRPKQAK